jgi:hypothetical protein
LTLGLNAEYARQSSWYRPSVSLKARLTLSVWPNPGFASRSKQSRYKPVRTTRGPLFAKIQTWTFANPAQNGNGSGLAQLRPVTQ